MFFITSLLVDNDRIETVRCFGYAAELESARRMVHENVGDLHEDLYTHLVIEEIQEGIHAPVLKSHWYAFEDEKWVPLEDYPWWANGITNFSIG